MCYTNNIKLQALRFSDIPECNRECGENPQQLSLLCLAFAISQIASASPWICILGQEEAQPFKIAADARLFVLCFSE